MSKRRHKLYKRSVRNIRKYICRSCGRTSTKNGSKIQHAKDCKSGYVDRLKKSEVYQEPLGETYHI